MRQSLSTVYVIVCEAKLFGSQDECGLHNQQIVAVYYASKKHVHTSGTTHHNQKYTAARDRRKVVG